MAYAAAAYMWWGLFPLYFRALNALSAPEILAHRILWSVAFLAILITVRGDWSAVLGQLRTPGTMRWLVLSATLISTNWLIYIWAVNAEHVMEASLGYYVNPLVSVLLGVAFLGEPLTRRQLAAVALAGAGVLALVVRAGRFPWVSLTLAATFALYGLIRKRVPVDATAGLLGEVTAIAPLAAGYLAFAAVTGRSHFPATVPGAALVAASGVITAVPLIWFAIGVKRLRLATIGLLQYLNPTMQFGIAVLAFGERFTPAHRIAFGCIWTALAIYTSEAVGVARRAR